MAGDGIRIQYSGFIIFAAQILSVGTGLVFTLLLTRNLSPQQYGIWANVFDVIGYFMLLSGVFPFWTMRFVARRKQGAAKTGFLANLVVSLLFALLYIGLAQFIASAFGISGQYTVIYFVASVQIVNLCLIAALESILRAKRPQAVGYGLLVEEICKVVLAYVLIVRFGQLLLGALLSLIVAASIQVLYYLKLVFPELRERIQWAYVREWLKSSIINIYNAVGNQLAASTIILLFVLGGQAARGNYQAAATYANVIGYALFLSYALYPKLLIKSNPQDITSTLKVVLLFAIPMTTIALSIPVSLLTILNVHFGEAFPILMFLAVDGFIVLISQFYSSVILGAERVDEEARIPLMSLVGSRIFSLFSLPYIQAIITLPTCFYVLTTYALGEPINAAVFTIAITMAGHLTVLALQCWMTRNLIHFGIPWKNIGKYVTGAFISALFFLVAPKTSTIVSTFAIILIGGGIYASVVLAADKDARHILTEIWHELKIMGGAG